VMCVCVCACVCVCVCVCVSRFRNEYRARYRVNSEGWNSKYEHYSINKSQAKLRLTVIGDSFVQARQVDFDKSLAERLEQKLGSDRYEVYRFGVSAAPLSQYLQVFRTEVVNYSPDLAIFVLIHNDFEESYNFELGRYTTSFLRLKLESGRVEEIAPRKYERPWYSWIRGSATYRYLVDRQHLNIQSVKNFVNYYRFKTEFQANIDVSNVGDRARFDELATDYVFRRIKEIAESRSIRLLMVMDGDRRSIYKGVPSDRLYARGALMLNKMAQRLAKKYNIAFIDLHPVFEENYRLNKKSFDFENDTHWNEYGHEIAARAIYQHLRDDIEN